MFELKNIEIFSDRDKIRLQLIDYMKEYLELENVDLSKTSYLSYLINILSVLTSNLIYYNTSVYREFFLTRAIQKESVLNLASMLGYTPPFAISAKAQLLIGIPTTFDSNIEFTIPNNFQYFSNDTVFEQDNSIEVTILNPGTTSVAAYISEVLPTGGFKIIPSNFNDDKSVVYFTVDVTQQETQEFEYSIPKLNPYEFYDLSVDFDGNPSDIIIESYTDIDSSIPTIWTQYDSLFLIPSEVMGYSYRATASGIKLFFGNGIIGYQPNEGDVFKVIISTTKGFDGNVITGSINKADKLFVSVDNGTTVVSKPIKMEVVNNSPATGGENSPLIDEIRSSAIANVCAGKRLVTEWDYKNLRYVIPDIPTSHTVQVLKRSDIKRNEISVFTDLIFEDSVVPTKNAKWPFEWDGTCDGTACGTASLSCEIQSGDLIDIDGEEYYSLFDISIDPQIKESKYYYMVNDANAEVTLIRTFTNETEIIPIYCNFTLTRTGDFETDYITLTLSYNQIEDGDYSHLTCILKDGWTGTEYDMVHNYDQNTFSLVMLVQDIPAGNQFFYFEIKSSSTTNVCTAQTEMICRRDLSEYMYSQVRADELFGLYIGTVYDVPVIKRSYYDNINQNDFLLQVLHKVINFDALDYRMLTDFVNLKFSNTTGKLTNMLFNKIKTGVQEVDPAYIPSFPAHGVKYLLTRKDNPWGRTPPCITEWSELTEQWGYGTLNINDMISDGSTGAVYIYNGSKVIEPTLDIPFEIKMVVWRDTSASISAQALVTLIKNTLIDKFYIRFGYDQAIYRSEVIKTVQSIDGVAHCDLKEPQHDIFFDYDIYEDFTQEQLLEYSPQLVYFDINSITIEIK